MRTARIAVILLAALLVGAPAANAQTTQRDTTRERVRQVLDTAGPRADVAVDFRQSTKNPYNFVGSMTTGLRNADSLEIVISITRADTIGFRIYPHYKNAYANIDRARDPNGLMRKLLYFSDQNFLFWGADDGGDVFCGYTVTLESGFPPESMLIVLRSIRNSDKFFGELRPFLDGTAPA